MRLIWTHGDERATCPACGDASAHARVVSVEDVAGLGGPLGFRRCPSCGVLHADRLVDGSGQERNVVAYYVEQGAAIDLLCEPLLRVAGARRLLDVGCGFGFALDFARRGLGMEALGVDPSGAAARGREVLGHDLVAAPLTPDLDLGGRRFDVALASEVIEHVTDPGALLRALRARLGDDGVVRLTTPDADAVAPGVDAEAVGATLSPGHHAVLFRQPALEALLRRSGFAHLRWESVPGTLRCWAAPTAAGLARVGEAAADGVERFRDYLAARADGAEPGSMLALGCAYRHLKSVVNAGLWPQAETSATRLRAAMQARHAIDLERPQAAVEALAGRRFGTLEAMESIPYCLSTSLHFLGMLALAGRGDAPRAAELFEGSCRAADILLAAEEAIGVFDGETRDLRAHARRHQDLAHQRARTAAPVRVRALPPGREAGANAGTEGVTVARPAPRGLVRRGVSAARRRLRRVAPPRSAASAAPPASGPAAAPADELVYQLEVYWADAAGVLVAGWLQHDGPVRSLALRAGERSTELACAERPDVQAMVAGQPGRVGLGFEGYLATPAGTPLRLVLRDDRGEREFPLLLPAASLPVWPRRRAPDVAVLGARLPPDSRILLLGARHEPSADGAPDPVRARLAAHRLLGVDIHPGLGVELVADAHRLAECVLPGSVDAVVSGALLEHLEAPWLVAAAVNRVLRPGGLVYHWAPYAWPAHSEPNDFWRMSADGLRALFGAATGFEVILAENVDAAALLPDSSWRAAFLRMPTVPAWTGAVLLARKVRDLAEDGVAWPLGAEESAARARSYPVSGLSPHEARVALYGEPS